MNIIRALPALVLYFLATSFSHAALTPIGPLDFASGATVLDFSALADNTEANGLIVDGVLFQATKNGSSTNGVVIVGGGPGTTGNITPPNLVSLSDLNAIALIVSLPNLAIQFGYGYALNAAVSGIGGHQRGSEVLHRIQTFFRHFDEVVFATKGML